MAYVLSTGFFIEEFKLSGRPIAVKTIFRSQRKLYKNQRESIKGNNSVYHFQGLGPNGFLFHNRSRILFKRIMVKFDGIKDI